MIGFHQSRILVVDDNRAVHEDFRKILCGGKDNGTELAAAEGQVSLHFLNTSGAQRVAPFGGSDRRLSTNPITVGVPVAGVAVLGTLSREMFALVTSPAVMA